MNAVSDEYIQLPLWPPSGQVSASSDTAFIPGAGPFSLTQKEKKREYMRKWKISHPEYMHEYMRKWRASHKEQIQETRHKWRASHLEQARETWRKWKASHLKQVRETLCKWKKEHPEAQRNWRKERPEYDRKWQACHPEQRHISCCKWRASHPEQRRAACQRYRARLYNAPGWDYTTAQHIKWRWEMWGNKCWICGKEAEATDHVKLLSRGGSHWPANLRPICTSCNSERNAGYKFKKTAQMEGGPTKE